MSADPALEKYIPTLKQLEGSKYITFGMNGMMARNTSKASMSILKTMKSYSAEEDEDKEIPELLNDGVFDSINLALYSYAGNNPVVFFDPTGLWKAKDKTVDITNLSQKMKDIEKIVDKIFKDVAGIEEATVTAGKESGDPHIKGSKHETGNAVDIRTRGLTKEQIEKIVNKLKKETGLDYDVIYHKPGEKTKDGKEIVPHIHIEYDPKG